MPAQGDPHVIDLHGDGVAPEQPLVQQFHGRTLYEAQLQQTTLQLQRMVLMMAMITDLDDDAAVAATGLAEFDGVGHGAHYDGAPRRSLNLTVIISCERFASSNDNRRRCD